ncbi:MAG: methyltransferase domain-containing protein [Candidatus Methanofastidiosum sp.]|nr:methyltransferase domain-containing protein [Methanofastidiosum sp.]
MRGYWNNRFLKENEIWGKIHSNSAELCLEYFSRFKIKNILIPGVGYGRNAQFFEKKGFIVEGIEISDQAIKIARNNSLTFPIYEGSVLEMPFNDKKYEGIYCFNVLHLFRQEDRKEFIDKCYNQLNPGGIIFFTVFSENEQSYGKGKKIEENTYETKPNRPVHYFTDEDLRNHFNKFLILDSGIMEDPENHGEEGPHTHIIRYIIAQKRVYHEFNGEKYKIASKHQKEWGTKIISNLKLKDNEAVLDLGCGDGALTKQIACLVPKGKVLGIDSSEGMISTAKDLEGGNLSFQKMDINLISFRGRFDLIFSNATLHWIKDHKKLLENCYNALKPGGSIRFNFAGQGNCSNFYKVIQDIISNERYKGYFESFEWPWYMPSIEEYKILLCETNFKEIEIWEENSDRYFENQDEMIRWIDQPSIVPFLRLVDTDDKDRFRKEVIEKMICSTKQKDGRCFETFRRINVYAVK